MSTFEQNSLESTVIPIGAERTQIVQVSDFFKIPELVVEAASSHRYAHINPHYPGIRASVEADLLAGLCGAVSDLVATHSGSEKREWIGQAWYSIVTHPKERLTPIQRLPHFDGFDESQLAVMIYLNQTKHGGTGFYRHVSTSFERVTEARYPTYKTALEAGVRKTGLPPARYIEDGAPHFAKIFESDARFNSLILYPGTILHSGVIDNQVDLPGDPRVGRLTINGFFRPAP
ncbi:MAG: DUF6445 family protein [Pseudomonadota bacterium]